MERWVYFKITDLRHQKFEYSEFDAGKLDTTDTTCCQSRVSSVIGYCVSLSSKVSCTVNTMYCYHNCAVWNCCAQGVRSTSATKSSFNMRNGCSEFNFWTVLGKCVIHHRRADGRAPGHRDKVTASLLGSPEMKAAGLSADSLHHTQPVSGFLLFPFRV